MPLNVLLQEPCIRRHLDPRLCDGTVCQKTHLLSAHHILFCVRDFSFRIRFSARVVDLVVCVSEIIGAYLRPQHVSKMVCITKSNRVVGKLTRQRSFQKHPVDGNLRLSHCFHVTSPVLGLLLSPDKYRRGSERHFSASLLQLTGNVNCGSHSLCCDAAMILRPPCDRMPRLTWLQLSQQIDAIQWSPSSIYFGRTSPFT